MEDQKIVAPLATRPDKLPPVGDYFEEGFKFLGKHWKKLLMYFVPLALLQVVIGYLDLHFFGSGEAAPIWATVITTILGIAISYVMICASDLYCRNLDTSAEAKPFSIYINGFKYFWKMLWAGILAVLVASAGVALAYVGGMAFFALGGVLSAIIGKGIVSSLLIGLMSFIGVAFIFFCYIFFILSVVFITYTVMLEEKKGLHAVMQSFWYAKGRKWGMFGRWFLMMLIPGIFATIGYAIGLGIIVSDLSFGALSQLSDPSNEISGSFIKMSLIVNLIVIPISHLFYSSFGYVLWKHAKTTAGSEEAQVAYRTSKRGKFVAAAWVGAVISVLLVAFAALAPLFLTELAEKADRAKNTSPSAETSLESPIAETVEE